MNKKKTIFPWVTILLITILLGCNSNNIVEPTLISQLKTPTPTIVVPTLIPIIEYPAKLVLFVDENVDIDFRDNIQTILQNYANQNSLLFEFRSNLFDPEISENLMAVVMLSNSPTVNELIALSPEVKIISVGLGDNEYLSEYSSAIDIPENGKASEGFIAGYIAAMQTEEWRVGMLGITDQEDYQKGFMNGVKYFCGTCPSFFPPYLDYPLYVNVDDGKDFSKLKTGVDLLLDKHVQTIYLSPGIENEELISYLAKLEINIIGDRKPIGVEEDHWIVSVSWNWLAEIKSVIPIVIVEENYGSFNPKLSLFDINMDNLAPSRQSLVNEIIELLEIGIVDPIGE